MCGICGFTGTRNDALLRTMAASLVHRGPDEDGFFTEEDRISLGMRRLKIIDLATGSQPIANEDGTVTVVFNGEIYNFMELRAELEAKGHRFRTRTDTEVLVHLYEEHGAEFPSRLRGMFAFALWDARKRELLLARDQFGIKPLFYSLLGGKLFFASELKALLLAPEIPEDLDLAALDVYFTRLYIPSPLTAYKHIRKLEPARTLVFRAGKADIRAYWSLPLYEGPAARTEGEYLEGIDGLLGSSVREQLVADVPLGLLLSGGMDSSSALYYMSKASSAPVKTFTIGYGERDAAFNETEKARLLAGHFGADHQETILEPDVRAIMEKLAVSFDEPFADASSIPTYLVTKEARKKVTVALTGVGGDELFGGYPRHMGARLLPAYLKLPAFLREAFWAGARHLPESFASRNLPGRFKRFVRGGRLDFAAAYDSWISYFTEEERGQLYAGGLTPSRSPLPGRLAGPDDIFAFEVRNYLSDDLLCLADRASMANSLELRVPFLDVRLAEFMAGAPLSLKTRGFSLKYLLKKLMADRLPAEITGGAKRGFQVPLARWYTDELKDFAHDLLSAPELERSGFLAPGYIKALMKENEQGRRSLGDQLYAAMMFELWLKNAPAKFTAASAPSPAGPARLTVVIGTDIIQDDDEGGSGRVAWELARRLVKFGHKVVVVTKGMPGKNDFEEIDGIELRRYFSRPLELRRILKDVRARYGKIDVLELHHPFTAALTMLFSGGAPAVYNFHSPWGREYAIRAAASGKTFAGAGVRLRKTVEGFVLRRARSVLNASVFMAAELRSEHGLESRVLPLGVDTEKFSPTADRAALRARLGIPADRFVIFTVRNLEPRMGLENLIEAAAALAAARPELLCIIGGRGGQVQKLAALIKERGLTDKVRLEGFIPEADLADYFRCADLFILPTRELEGFGLVTLEAMACGTPVLATPVGASPELLGPFGGEFLLADYSPAAIAAGISGFIARYGTADAELRGRCRKYIEGNYSWEKYASGVEKELYLALRGKGLPAGSCPLCSGPASASYGTLRRCLDCGLVFDTEKVLAPAVYEKDLEEAIYGAAKTELFASALDTLEEIPPGKGLLLDIGCAGGELLKAAAARGWQAEGVEIDGVLAGRARSHGFTVYDVPVESAGLPEARYDAVTAFEVLSQMSEPAAAAKEMFAVIKPGGTVYIREFNSSFHIPLYALERQGVFKALGASPSVIHNFNFGASSLRALLRQAGFVDIEIRNSRPTAGDPYRTGGRLVGFLTGALKVLYYWLAQALWLVTFGRVYAGSTLIATARK